MKGGEKRKKKKNKDRDNKLKIIASTITLTSFNSVKHGLFHPKSVSLTVLNNAEPRHQSAAFQFRRGE